MNSVQERLKLKRVPVDTWSIKEKLCLASAVLRSGDQNWMSVSRSLRLFGEPGRPVDWFSQKSCALQYGNLLENVDTPKRKKRTDKSGSEHVETPGEAIVRNLTHERINELKRLMQEEQAMYLKLKEEVAQIKAGQVDDRLLEMCQQIEEEEKQKEREAEAHKRWLQERQEKKIELERAWKPPVTPASPHRKKIQRGPGGNRRNSSQSEPSSEADSAVDSPLSEPLNVDVTGDETSEVPPEVKPVVPTPTSPLLTSLLKSPSPAAPTAQSSILHSAITAHHRGGSSSPTIASLLHSSPGVPAPGLSSVAPPPVTVSSSLKNLVTSAIGAVGSEDTPKPPSTSPAAGEVCHPQHQEMRVRREVGTDEPIEVVEVEQNYDAAHVPNLRDQVVGMEVIVGPQDGPSQKLIDELEVVTQAIADVERMEQEEQANRKAMLEAKALLGTKVEEVRGAAEDVKTLMEMPVLVENLVPEPHAIAQVIEVPAQGPSTGNLDIIIVDSSTLGGQEEVPPDAECQVVEVVLDPKSSDGSKQDAASSEAVASVDPQETFSSSGEQDIPLNDQKAAVEKEQADSVTESTEGEPVVGRSSDGTVMGGTETVEDASARELGMDEGSRIALVAIEIPTSKVEEKEICKTDKNEELSKQMEQNVKKNEDEMMVKEEIKQEATSVETTKHDKAVKIEDQKEKYDGTNELQASEGQCNEKNETTKEAVVNEVKRVAKGESVEDKAEETVETEKDVGGETGDEQCVLKEEDMLAGEHIEESVKQSEEEAEKRDTEVEDLVTEKISEATEEEDSHAESSEDEKKPDEKADRAEEENASTQHSSTGGKKWKEEDEEEEEDEEKREKGGADEVKRLPDKTVAVQKGTVRADTPSTEDDKTNDAVEPPRSNRRRGATATPVDSVPNSPAAPVTDEDREFRAWKKSIMLLYGRLATHKYASLFLRPITDDQAPGYSSIVHRPIDLLTVKKNIELGVTRTTAEFQRDVMLMFVNSIMYNKSSHFVHKMAQQMQQEGLQHVQDFLTTQMLVQVVGEAPLRRETRTTEANKQRDFLSTPGSSSQEEADGPTPSHNSKRKRLEQDRGSTKKRKLLADE